MLNPVVADTHELRLGARILGQDKLNRRVPEEGAHGAVERARGAATLNVTEDGESHILGHASFEDFTDVIGCDGFAVSVVSAFGNDDDAVPTSRLSARAKAVAQASRPVVVFGWFLGDEHRISTGCDGAHEGEIAAVSPHDLNDESALVAGGGARQGIDGLSDPVQCGVGTDGHIGAVKVVVDGSRKTGEDDSGSPLLSFLGQLSGSDEIIDVFGPLLVEEIGRR